MDRVLLHRPPFNVPLDERVEVPLGERSGDDVGDEAEVRVDVEARKERVHAARRERGEPHGRSGRSARELDAKLEDAITSISSEW